MEVKVFFCGMSSNKGWSYTNSDGLPIGKRRPSSLTAKTHSRLPPHYPFNGPRYPVPVGGRNKSDHTHILNVTNPGRNEDFARNPALPAQAISFRFGGCASACVLRLDDRTLADITGPSGTSPSRLPGAVRLKALGRLLNYRVFRCNIIPSANN